MKSCLLSSLRGFAARAFVLTVTLSFAAAVAPAAGQGSAADQASGRVTFITRPADSPLGSATDLGPMPLAQNLAVTLTLAPTPERTAALTSFLAEVTDASSPSFHKWLTPQQFAANYGATPDQISAATAWAQAQGLTVQAVSPSATRITLSGSALQMQNAFSVSLDQFQLNGASYFASTTQPSLPAGPAALFTAIEGLDNLPLDLKSFAAAHTAQNAGTSVSAANFATSVNGQPASLAPAALAAIVDANALAVLSLDATYGAGTPSPSRIAAYSALFRQAAAQGITTLLSRTASSGAIPSGLPEVTVVARPGDAADLSTPSAARPDWQNAPGLPADALRHAPDLTAASFAAFAQTIATLAQASGGRLGNINSTLYALAPTSGLYTQPDDPAAGTWEPATGLGLVDLTILAHAFPRGSGGVSVYITSTDYSPVHGQSFTLTATVYPGDGGAATGTMTFSSSQPGFTAATVPLNGNGAGVSTFKLPGGTYTITATYSGDPNYASGSGNTTIFVGPEAASFTLSAPGTATLGTTFAVNASLASTSGFGTPTGNVTVSVTGDTNQTQAVSGSGGTASTSFNFVASQAGTLAVNATCNSGDASFTCDNQPSASVAVAKVTPTVSLSLSTSTPLAGSSVTFTAGVTGVTGVTPTRTVQILDNGTSIASITLPATTASAPLTSGTAHTITAQYSGDGNYNTATSSASTATVGLAPTTITVTPYPSSFVSGQNTTLVIAVAPTSGNQANGTAPSGTVSVTAGSLAAVVSQPLNNGNVNVTLNNLAVGTYPITVSYAGDPSYAASTNTSQTVTVTPFSAVITPQLSYNMFTTGSTQTLTVQFASPTNSPVPSNAAFTATLNGVTYHGAFNINPGGVNATGQVTINAPIAGTYALQVNCVSNPAFTCNTPAPITVTSTATSTTTPPPTTGTGTTPTQTTLVSSSSAPAAGQSVSLTATVTAAASALAANPITGTVSFYDGSTLLDTEPVVLANSAYVATDVVTLTGGLTHQLTATYNGDNIYASSTSSPPVPVTSIAAPAQITLTSSVTSGLAGESITFTARVTGSTSSGVIPTGTVSFYLAGSTPTLLSQTGLSSAGSGAAIATYTTTGFPAGSQTVYAVYSGDPNFNSMTSNSVTVGLSDYSIAFTPASLTLAQGQSGTATLTVGLVNSFAGVIAFGCTPPPNTGITCSFSPSTLTGAGTTTLTVTTTAPKAQATQSASSSLPGSSPAVRIAGGASLAALLCFLLPGRARRRIPTLLLVFLALAITGTVGCAATTYYSSTPGSPISGTPLGTSILTINTAATDGSSTVRHNTFFQVTVQ